MDLMERYFSLNGQQRALLLTVVLVLFAGLLYAADLKPRMTVYRQAQADNKRAMETSKMLDAQLLNLRALGKKDAKIDAAQFETLKAANNELLFASQVPDFTDLLRELNDRLGGRNFRIEESALSSAYITVGERKDVYKLMKLPVKLYFESDYSVVSNYLFQVHALKHLLKFKDIDIRSKDFSSDLRVTVEMDIFFIEDAVN